MRPVKKGGTTETFRPLIGAESFFVSALAGKVNMNEETADCCKNWKQFINK